MNSRNKSALNKIRFFDKIKFNKVVKDKVQHSMDLTGEVKHKERCFCEFVTTIDVEKRRLRELGFVFL